MPKMKPKRNWDVINERPVAQQSKYRNVYEEQQLERTDIPRKISPFSRKVMLWVGTAVIGALLWLFCSLGEMGMYAASYGSDALALAGPFAFFGLSLFKVVVLAAVLIPGNRFANMMLMRNLKAQNMIADNSDINQHLDDQHIALPEEIMRDYDIFPDVGAHSSVSPSTMISHVMLDNHGVQKVEVVDPYDGDDISEQEDEFYARIDGDREELSIVRVPMFDHGFGDALFEASGLPKDLRKWFSPNRVPYNPGNANRDKLRGYNTYADVVNGDWEVPYYETQRPAGAYIVDGAPVNTMVLAITRAGKGQTYIEPMLDMWTREKRPNNILANDPKGELLQKFYVPAVVRGFMPVQFNLINELKTDIYNPLALAAEAAREADFVQCSTYIENIATVFFPVDGADDPVWPNAANNAFKRAAFGLIDFYMEEERKLRREAAMSNMSEAELDTRVDQLWGKVTLYNCYQLFVQLTSRKRKNPVTERTKIEDSNTKYQKALKDADGDATKVNDPLSAEQRALITDEARWKAYCEETNFDSTHLFNGAGEADELSLYFAATECLPNNGIRTQVTNTNNALKSMGAAEKMLASVYGIAVTAMSFFTDPRIRTLTSGTPSQNVDLAGLSFPRRLGVRFHADFVERYHLVGMQGIWSAYEDATFTKPLGKPFDHECFIKRDGWARYAFDGIFPEDVGYIKLELRNAQTGNLSWTFYFRFTKSYQRSLDGRYYVKDPVLDERIIRNGIIEELVPDTNMAHKGQFKLGHHKFGSSSISINEAGSGAVHRGMTDAITMTSVHYAEKPKFVFLVTPPHLMAYAKLILILVKQLVDVSFDQSYMTKANQKPLYKTRYMLDELGNLQSEGHGIDGFQTMLSIGLGQDQQFTLILQTLQQLTDVYGESVDKIVQGNAQPLTSLVATPDGWCRMGDVREGTRVVTPRGTFAQVNGVFPRGKRKVYRVTRTDGSSCLACGEHLWVAKVG